MQMNTDSLLRNLLRCSMLIPPWNGVNTSLNEVTAAVRYQTLWADANWADEAKVKYIMESELPKDFNLSVYYAESRELLIQDSTRKAQAKAHVKRLRTAILRTSEWRDCWRSLSIRPH